MTAERDEEALLAVAEHHWDRTPWEPEGLSFEVGDRVVIRLSGECRKEWRRSHGYPKVVGLTAREAPVSPVRPLVEAPTTTPQGDGGTEDDQLPF